MESPKGFVAALFDPSFSEFITTRLVKVLYILGIVLAGITTLIVLFGALFDAVRTGLAAGFLLAIAALLTFLIAVIVLRVWLELVIVIFRIAETLREIANK